MSLVAGRLACGSSVERQAGRAEALRRLREWFSQCLQGSDQQQGHIMVCQVHAGRPEGPLGQRTLPGSCFKNPQDSAAELAYFLAGHRGELGMTEARRPRRDAEVSPPVRLSMLACAILSLCSCVCHAGDCFGPGRASVSSIQGAP